MRCRTQFLPAAVLIFSSFNFSFAAAQATDPIYDGAPLDLARAERVASTPGSSLDPESAPSLDFATYAYTFADLVAFSYQGATDVQVLSIGGGLLGSATVAAGGHYVWGFGDNVYGLQGSAPFALLTGDPLTRTVLGYFSRDASGSAMSRDIHTYMPAGYFPERFAVFSYYDGTAVEIRDDNTEALIWTGILDAGQHYSHDGLARRWLHITGSQPVTVMSSTDQGFYIPSSNGTFCGTQFHGWVTGHHASEDFNVCAYQSNTHFEVRDSGTQGLLYSGTLNQGQVYTGPSTWGGR